MSKASVITTSMEFTPELTAFQGTIISADNVHSFSKLTAKGGNEDKIDYVISCLKKYLQKAGLISEDGLVETATLQLRKMAMYIVLNSDIKVLEEMVELQGVDFVIWTVPTITKCLMCEMLWKLQMSKYVYEIVAFSYPMLAMEVADALIDNIKYFTPAECLDKVKLLCIAYYRLICRLYFFNIENNLLSRASSNFQKCLKYFTEPPNAGKLECLQRDDIYKYIGKRIYEMLTLLLDCFDQFTTKQTFRISDNAEIYSLTYKEGSFINDVIDYIPSECTNKQVCEYIANFNEALLDKAKELVMGISVDIFCAWSEFEEDGISMQRKIGEMGYKVQQSLCKINSISEHSLINMLLQISCKPVFIHEIINDTDSTVISENINKNDNDKSQWIKALLCREQLCSDLTLVQHISANLDVFDENDAYKLFNIFQSYLNDRTENEDFIKLVAIKMFQKCNVSMRQEIVKSYFRDKIFTDAMETSEFNNMLTEVFNKLIVTTNIDMSDILHVFLQNPKKCYVRIFKLAAENVHQTNIMHRVIMYLEEYSSHFYSQDMEPCVLAVTKKMIVEKFDNQVKQDNFIKFISELKRADIIQSPKLLLLIIMPNLHNAIKEKNISSIDVHCRLLFEAYSLGELTEFRSPMLAMLAQVMEKLRWKINVFLPCAPGTLDLALRLQTALLNTCNDVQMSEKERNWLRSKLKNMNPLNMYYYRKLWDPPGNTFVEVISGVHIHKGMDMEQLKLWLSQVLSSTTQQEWYYIWDSLKIFGDTHTLDIFHDALLLTSMAERVNRNETTWACMLYCYRNFVLTTRFKFFKEPVTDNQVLVVMKKFITIENIIEEQTAEEVSKVLLPLLAYMAEKKTDYTHNIPNRIHNKLKHKVFIDMINNLYCNRIVSE